jgi:AraC family transcriptional regulator, 4-hydroxyphenylacetate 3-monooxygenase operon regulatory protein
MQAMAQTLPTPDFSLQLNAQAEKRMYYHWLARRPNPGRPLAENELPGIDSIGFWQTRQPQLGPQNRPSPLREVQISFYENRGALLHTADRQHFLLEDNSLVLTLPFDANCYESLRGTGYWINWDLGIEAPGDEWTWPSWLSLTQSDLAELTRLWSQRRHPVFIAGTEMRETFHRLAVAIKKQEAGGDELSRMQILLGNLLWNLLQLLRPRKETPALEAPESVRRRVVRDYLQKLAASDELYHGQLFASTMAEACAISPSTLISITRQLTGETPALWLLSRRLERAAQRLRAEPHRSITQIAEECGFNTSQYFATRFKKRFGCSPKSWRETARG